MLYKNCRELPYHNFNEIQITNNFSYLIKNEEKHDEDELGRHWVEILDEYFKLSNDFSQKKFFRDRSELMFLELKYEVLSKLDPIVDYGVSEEQQADVDKIFKIYRVTDLKRSILGTQDDINLKINQFKKLNDNQKSGNFEEALAVMRMNGYQVNRHLITVSEWVALLDQMKKQNKPSSERKR